MYCSTAAYRSARAAVAVSALALSACGAEFPTGNKTNAVFAPGVDMRSAMRADAASEIETGHRLVAAGEYELALRSFSRAALDRGETDAEILLGMGTANLGLGRLGQSERLLRLGIEKENAWPELWNNLGVVLIERGQTLEAQQIFHKAYAMDNGNSDAIRDNLRLALSRTQAPVAADAAPAQFKLVRRGNADYLLRNQGL